MLLTELKQKLGTLEGAALAETDYTTKGYHLEVRVSPAHIVEAAAILDQAGCFLEAVTGVDLLTFEKPAAKPKPKPPAEGEEPEPEMPAAPAPPPQMEVVYDFNHFAELCRVVVKVLIDRAEPELPTISALIPGADWHERETHDFFGIVFTGHPDLSPLLLPEDADFHPLLKDFAP